MVAESTKEKIRKIQALVDRAGTEGEAQAAVLAMQRLLNRHGLSEADVQFFVNEEENEEATDTFVESFGRKIRWKGQLLSVLSKNFRCIEYWAKDWNRGDGGRRGSKLHVVGMPSDVEMVSITYHFTIRSMERLFDEFLDTHYVRDGRASRTSYMEGFINGLSVVLKEQVETTPGMDLVLVRNEKVETYADGLHLTYAKVTTARRAWDNSAYAKGRKDGADFNVSAAKKPVGIGAGNKRIHQGAY